MELPVIALDVGGATLKATRVAPHSSSTKAGKHALPSSSSDGSLKRQIATLSNQIATTTASSTSLLGKELLEKERQRSKLHYVRPIERGYCVNWNVESELWSHLFTSKSMLGINPHDYALVATAPLFAPTVTSETMDQVVFEEFGFQSFSKVSAAEMCVLSYAEYSKQQARVASGGAQASPKRKKGAAQPLATADEGDDWTAFHKSSCQLVVDSGFSFTHVVPMIDRRVYHAGVKRINVGGKLLTNYLKEIVSFRQWNVMDETLVINELKESLCYCSLDFTHEMTRLQRDRQVRKHWILPDFVHSFQGRLRPDANPEHRAEAQDEDQALEMGVEMVSVPEVLFHPSDIGIDQAGIAEAIMQSVNACPVEVRGTLLENILVVGGNSKFRHFRERLEQDLRPLVPQEYSIRILQPEDPISAAVDGCAIAAGNASFANRFVSKKEYEEYGSNICLKRFR